MTESTAAGTRTIELATVKATVTGAISRIVINRPDKLNALNADVLRDLRKLVSHDSAESVVGAQVRAIVIEGAGDRAFVAGADIAAMRKLSPVEARRFAREGQSLTRQLEALNQVTIAKVQGFAFGGGCELAMACDLVIAGQNARFGQPEVNLGLIAGFGGTQRLVRRVGLPVALDMLLCGKARILSGLEAHSLGLVSRVVEDDKLEDEVKKVLQALLGAAPGAIAETKRLARAAYAMSLDAGLDAEATAFATAFADDEAQDGMAAFLEKRAPKFMVP